MESNDSNYNCLQTRDFESSCIHTERASQVSCRNLSSKNIQMELGKSDPTEVGRKTGNFYYKKCPSCFKDNEQNATYCFGCGRVILSVEVRRNSQLKCDAKPYVPLFESCSVPDSHESLNNYLPSVNESKIRDEFSEKEMATNSKKSFDNSLDIENSYAEDAYPHFFMNKKMHTNNPAIYTRTTATYNKQAPYFYAFDDLLYPAFAIHDPLLDYVFPSSNVVSGGQMFHQQQLFQRSQQDTHENMTLVNTKQEKVTTHKKKNQHHKKKHSSKKKKLSNKRHHCLPLPDELILVIFAKLDLADVCRLLSVCKQTHRVASDKSLWKRIRLQRSVHLTDGTLLKIASNQPQSLAITQSNAKHLTENGLTKLFQSLSHSLIHLNISACSGLNGDFMAQQIATSCRDIVTLDVSWNNLNNASIATLINSLEQLVHLSLNGCQAVSDESINQIANTYSHKLETLEIFGCFNVTSAAICALTDSCKNITKLNLGQCHKVSNFALSAIARNLSKLQSLDLRGCKKIKDIWLREVLERCVGLKTLVIANCHSLTDVTLHSLQAIDLISLDVCGCGKISDKGVQSLAKTCPKINHLDLSSTKVTGKSVSAIASKCAMLESLKLSFCTGVTDQALYHLVNKCKRLNTLHLYGVKALRNVYSLHHYNPNLKIERESLR